MAATLSYDTLPTATQPPSPPTTTTTEYLSIKLLAATKYLLCRETALSHTEHRDFALNISLYSNVIILATKAVAFGLSGSLSVLAALMDSALDIISQIVLYWAERRSSNASTGLYPAGASKFEPVGVIICAALMGMGSFQVIR